MGLLKYLGKPEVIKVLGEKEPKRIVMDGPFIRTEKLYPEGTERIVKKFYYLSRQVGENSVRGNQIVRQVCRHRIVEPNFGDQSPFTYESWNDIGIIS